jgi:hypothetical protein
VPRALADALPSSALPMVIQVRVFDTYRVFDLIDMDMKMIFYLWVTSVSDLN